MKGVTPESLLSTWGDDFEAFESKVFYGEDLSGSLDMESLVNYMLVYNVCGNREPAWPKSVYLYKASLDDVYHFGPIWDFDWGFTYNDGVESGSYPATVGDFPIRAIRRSFFKDNLFQTRIQNALPAEVRQF